MQRYRIFFSLVVLATWVANATFAQTTSAPPATATAPPSAPAAMSDAELEKLVAPIALYPDPLLAILLPASAYPIEIVQAARFVKDTNNIPMLDSQPWDENVKALARFPEVIAKMDADIGWTTQLGQAFAENQKSVMEATQRMRNKAQGAGTLKSSPQQVVTTTNEVVQKTVEQQVVYVTNTIVQIQPSQPQVVYVPQYNPSVVYAPAPAYAYDPVAPLVTFGVGMAVGAAIANNNCDWHSGGVYVGPRGGVAWGGGHHGDGDVNINQNVNVNRTANVNRANGQQWQPDPNRRTSGATSSTLESRGWGGQASQNASAARAQASQNASAARSQASQNASATRAQASQNASAARSQASQNASAARSQASQNASAARSQASERASAARSQSAAGSAFNSGGGAAQARAAGARGSVSRGGGGGGRR